MDPFKGLFAMFVVMVALNFFLFAVIINVVDEHDLSIHWPPTMKTYSLPFSVDFESYGGVTPTGSMYPLIQDDSIILYESVTNISNLKLNDIYAYTDTDGSSILHRLIVIDGDNCYFKGDHNLYVDAAVNCTLITEHVVGITYKSINKKRID